MKKKRFIMTMTKIAIFSALSLILYVFPKFPLPFFPPFLKVQFSNLPAFLAGYVLGPLGGGAVVVIRYVLNLLIFGSGTGGSGELADLIIGLSAVLSSSVIYTIVKTKKGGLIGLVVGSIVWVLAAVFTNVFIAIPYYKHAMFGGSLAPLVGLCSKIIPNLTEANFMVKYVMFAVIPFNLMLSVIVSIITFFVYKRVSIIFKSDFTRFSKKQS